MDEAPIEHWEALGRAVLEARKVEGFRDTKKWVARVGRSSRMLLGLERGERVGQGTLESVAEALGWDMSVINGYLADPSAMNDLMTKHRAARVERALGLGIGLGPSGSLAAFTDDELLGELGRRLAGIQPHPGEAPVSIQSERQRRAVEQAQPVTQAAGTTSPRKPEPDPESQDDGSMEPS